MNKVHSCALLTHHLADIDLPECHSALNRRVKCFKRKMRKRSQESQASTYVVADDMIIVATTVEEHDKILAQVLQRAKERNITLNFDKLQLRVSEVKYLGTIITPEGMKPDPAKLKAIAEMTTPMHRQSRHQRYDKLLSTSHS